MKQSTPLTLHLTETIQNFGYIEGKIQICRFSEALSKNLVSKLRAVPTPIKVTPNIFKTEPSYLVHQRVVQLLNGEEINITNNRLILNLSTKICPDAEEVKKIVDALFNPEDPLLQIVSVLNEHAQLDVKIDRASVKVTSPINDKDFFNYKGICLRIFFSTKISLAASIPDLSEKELSKGIPVTKQNLMTLAKAVLNNPEGFYVSDVRDSEAMPFFKNEEPQLTLFPAPKDSKDLQEIFFWETFRNVTYKVSNVYQMLTNTTLQKTGKTGSIYLDSFFDTGEDINRVFGNEKNNGYGSVKVKQPQFYQDFSEEILTRYVNKLKEAIECGEDPRLGFFFGYKNRDFSVAVDYSMESRQDQDSWNWHNRNTYGIPAYMRTTFYEEAEPNIPKKIRYEVLQFLHQLLDEATYVQKIIARLHYEKGGFLRALSDEIFNRIYIDPAFYSDSDDKRISSIARKMLIL